MEWVAIRALKHALHHQNWDVKRNHGTECKLWPEAYFFKRQHLRQVVRFVHLKIHCHARKSIGQGVMRLPDDNTILVAAELSLHPDLPLWSIKGQWLTELLRHEILHVFICLQEAIGQI